MGARASLGHRPTNGKPAGARLDRDVDWPAGKPLDPRANGIPCRLDPATGELIRLGIERVTADLSSVRIGRSSRRERSLHRRRMSRHRESEQNRSAVSGEAS
jgi:hypothetical protein